MNSENSQETSGTKLGWKLGFYFVIMLVALPIFFVVLDQNYDKERKHYRENGYEVTATIVAVYEIPSVRRPRTTTKVIVIYQSPDGQLIRAGTKNPPSYTIGEQYIGKVVEDDPNMVYREVQEWKEGKLIFLIGFAVFYLLNLFFLVMILRRKRADKKLAVKGAIAEAEVIRCDTYGNETFVDISFKDENGLLYNASCVAPPNMNLVAKTCFVRYVVTSENSVDCEIVSSKKR
ncbi:MAG: DUF3592 domain-containing protein [Oscillospiraceae bacterium]|nr:DUF3592 domain-containing protein [Oscillospiraceae bacterium]